MIIILPSHDQVPHEAEDLVLVDLAVLICVDLRDEPDDLDLAWGRVDVSLLVELLDHCPDLFAVELSAFVLVVSFVDDVDDLVDLVGFVGSQRPRDAVDSFVFLG